jgi:hypothetical protein
MDNGEAEGSKNCRARPWGPLGPVRVGTRAGLLRIPRASEADQDRISAAGTYQNRTGVSPRRAGAFRQFPDGSSNR